MSKNDSRSSWYLHKQGQQQGPFLWEKLWFMAQSGEIAEQDLIWQQGMEQWQPAGKVPGLLSSRWFVARDGNAQGPFTWAQLGQQFRQGEISRQDMVWGQGLAGWKLAGEVLAPGGAEQKISLATFEEERRLSLLTLAGQETTVQLFGCKDGKWQQHFPDKPSVGCQDGQARKTTLATITANLKSGAGLHFRLNAQEAVVFKAVASLTWLLAEKMPAAAFCTVEDIKNWLEKGEQVDLMLMVRGMPEVQMSDLDVGQALAGLARHGLAEVWDKQLARLTERGKSLARFLLFPRRLHLVTATENSGTMIYVNEVGFLEHEDELLLVRAWGEESLLWSLDKKTAAQALDWLATTPEQQRALDQLEAALQGEGAN